MAPIREVWEYNLESEFDLISDYCSKEFGIASMDTEFQRTIFTYDIPKHKFSWLSPAQLYELMKENVNALNVTQLGLTLTDSTGEYAYVWEFNFRSFDPKRRGICYRSFAARFLQSGLRSSARAWVTFHGLYDFGFLIKLLTGDALPDDLEDFMALLRHYLGNEVYDLKPIMRCLTVHGGLDAVAKTLSVERAAGKSHQAGSDSLLTMQVFMHLMDAPTSALLPQFNYLLQGLTC